MSSLPRSISLLAAAILTTNEEIDVWLRVPTAEAMALQKPLADGNLKIVAKGERHDAPTAVG